nr:transketolase [Campylobacterota bacterium]
MAQKQLLTNMANTIRFLSADMVQSANSGHPGAPMGLADIVTVLSLHLNHNPKNPKWLNRDRVVFSGGHASAMIYSLLHLWGYDMQMEDLKNFRQFGSKTPGHPEYHDVPGVEVTTGPLGQGVANAVGFAMASKYAAKLLNSETAEIIDHKVYCLCGDGDLEEGISYEACSLAGHNTLDNLVLIYDSNKITIEGDTDIAWSEDVKARFEAQGWKVFRIDGHDYAEIDQVLSEVRTEQNRPCLVIAETTIAKGADEMEGSHHSHGAPLGDDEIARAKKKAGFDPEKKFFVSDEVLEAFREAVQKGETSERAWKKLIMDAPLVEQNKTLDLLLNPDFSRIQWPEFEEGSGVATRDSNGQILNAIAKAVPGFIGGSADLGPSNKTELKGMGDFPNGKNIHFGIREHAMGAITNAMSLYGLFIPFSATFFVFSDYMKPSVRLAALMGLKNHFVWTHDSIGVGEDGPTHQPIEHLSQFRALPNFYIFRPADASENVVCWQKALELDAPSGFVLSRQKLKTLKTKVDVGDASHGGYMIKKREGATVTIMATGSEVMPSLQAACHLESVGVKANVVSVPCFELFNEQDEAYKKEVVDPKTKVLAVEAGSGIEWYRYADDVLGMTSFGASGDANKLFESFGLTIEGIKRRVFTMIGQAYQETTVD